MSLMKTLLFFAIVGAAVHFWNQHETTTALTTATVSPNGFIDLPAPTNLDNDQVIVFAAENCPKEAGQRADRLAEELDRQNVPNTRVHSASFDLKDPDPAVLSRLDSVMQGTLPIVFVNGKGKANPTLDEVVSEYSTTPQ
jgi:hypothetical protein